MRLFQVLIQSLGDERKGRTGTLVWTYMHAHLTVPLYLQAGLQQVGFKLLSDQMHLVVGRLRWLVPFEFHEHLANARRLSSRYAASSSWLHI